jgi:putative transposase
MPIPRTTLLATLSSIFRSRAALELENLALRATQSACFRDPKENAEIDLRRPPVVDLSFPPLARLALGAAIVKPETVVAWHGAGFRLFWTLKVRRGQPGQPLISREVRDLIRQMCRENPSWGAPRIHGELLKLGVDIAESR